MGTPNLTVEEMVELLELDIDVFLGRLHGKSLEQQEVELGCQPVGTQHLLHAYGIVGKEWQKGDSVPRRTPTIPFGRDVIEACARKWFTTSS
jgi:hypothetical protein